MTEAELKEIEKEIQMIQYLHDEHGEHCVVSHKIRGILEKLLEEVKRLREDRQECHKLLKEIKQLKAEAMHPPMYTDQKGKEYYVLKVHPSHKITQEMIDKLDLLFPVKLDVDNSTDKEEK